uniref:Ig-like domain-containing protein n=1 Tax=Gopherus evgoodei TaxID=1825980 RepID=A0A8C5F0K4_9SAUR
MGKEFVSSFLTFVCERRVPCTWPSITITPSSVEGAVTLRCQCRCEARSLFLYKDGIQIQELDAAGDRGEFTIPSARCGDTGFYNCRSRSRSEPPNCSDPSDSVEIIVTDLGSGSASPLPAPHPGRPTKGLHADGMLRARLCPELWAQQRVHPAGKQGWSHWRVPSCLRFRAEGGRGIPAPRGPCGVT